MRLRSQLLTPILLVSIVLMMVIPINPALLDLLLAANFTFAILILLGTLLLKDSLEFSVFPSLLLVSTLARLALNVSSTRLILLDAYAGKVIDTFGGFVIGRSVIVGLVVFLILIVIQFVVITNGAGRVAEVAARFTLDAMPGKQMAIDADLGAGLIDEVQARDLRKRIAKEADFYGAMDGASKFVKGDAIAGIVIVAINLIGGFAIGMGSLGLDFADAVDTYSRLSVGDGLVSQIPALLISLATGLLITRVGSEDDMGSEIAGQVFRNRMALRIGAAVVAGLGLLPGLPKIPFFLLAGVLLVAGSRSPEPSADPGAGEMDEAPEIVAGPDDPEALIVQMRVEPLELHLAYDMLDLIDPAKGGDLLERVRALRRQMANELGIVMPYVRTRDDVSLPAGTYRVRLRGSEVGRGKAPLNRVMALPIGDGEDLRALGGEETVEPVFGLKAFWLPAESRAAALATGATVVDRSSAIVTHLAELVRRHAASLLSRQDLQLLLEGLRQDEPILANEVGTDTLPLATLHAVLRGLLDEQVSIRDLGRIIEAITGTGPRTLDQMINSARVALGGAIVGSIAPDGNLAVITLDPGLEGSLHEALREIDGQVHLVPDPAKLAVLQNDVQSTLSTVTDVSHPVAIVCSQMLRRPLKQTLAGMDVDVPVVAYPELPPYVHLIPIGVIGHGTPVTT